MQKNILILLVTSIILGFSFTNSLAQTTAEQQAQSVIEQEAARLYNNLSLLSINDRKSVYSSLTPELKSELWKVQSRSYLSKHSDLTDEQKKAIADAIVFIRPEFYKIPPDSPDWEEKVNKPLQLFEKRMLEVFPRGVIREFLTNLGGSEPRVPLSLSQINFVPKIINSGCSGASQEVNPWLVKKPIKKQPQTFSVIPASFSLHSVIPDHFDSNENCTCSTRSDWCWEGSECGSSNCRTAQWCGTLGAYICNGVCLISASY